MRDSEIGPEGRIIQPRFYLEQYIYFSLLFLFRHHLWGRKAFTDRYHYQNNQSGNRVRRVHVCIIQIPACLQQVDINDIRISDTRYVRNKFHFKEPHIKQGI